MKELFEFGNGIGQPDARISSKEWNSRASKRSNWPAFEQVILANFRQNIG
jgi:hypothetical protein